MIIDLSYPIHKGMLKYPSDPEIEIKKVEAKIEEEEVFGWSEGDSQPLISAGYTKYKSGYMELKSRNHIGTHLDFPSHKIPGGKTLSDYPISDFINSKCRILDLSNILGDERKIDLAHIIQFIDQHSLDNLKNYLNQEDIAIRSLIFYSGFSDKIKLNEELLNKSKKIIEEKFTYFTPRAAEYIVEQAKDIKIIGIDSFSVDPSGSNSEAHRIFFKNEILLLENLVNLKELNESVGSRTFELNCVPISLDSADASSVRAYAKI